MKKLKQYPFVKAAGLVFGLALVLSLVYLPATGATEVGGAISSDTTWTSANSPYKIVSGVLIMEGVTLTVESGVMVKFDGNYSIQVDGTLVAQGTSDNGITFTSNKADPAPGNWGYTFFTDTSTDATYDSDGNYTGGSILQYVTVEYGGGADVDSPGAIRVKASKPFINHCNIRKNAASGIQSWNKGAPRITHNSIVENSGSHVGNGGGIDIRNNHSMVITYNTISNNSSGDYEDGGGVYISDSAEGSELTLSHNTISDNSAADLGGGIYISDYSGSITITIKDNTFLNNNASSWISKGGGIFIATSGELIVNNNTISKNSANGNHDGEGGGVYIDYYGDTEKAKFSDNEVSKNSASAGEGGGIYISGLRAVNNIVEGNKSESGGGIYVDSATLVDNTVKNNEATSLQGGGVYLTGDEKFKGNKLTGNTAGDSSGAGGLYVDEGHPTINCNEIHDNTGYELYNHNPEGSGKLNATHNWWGTTDEATIKSEIYDWFDDSNVSIVSYSPYLSEPGGCGSPPVATINYSPTEPAVGTTVQLDGNESSDPDGDELSYSWQLDTPDRSSTTLSDPSVVAPSFVPDVAGSYQAKLVVNDGLWGSNPASKTIDVSSSDTNSPDPDPMTWSTEPDFTGATTVEMEATAASDPEENGVEYKFKETTGHSGGNDSDWQSSRYYTDSELEPDTQYCYQVKARDKSPNQNETDWSNKKCATPLEPPTASFTYSPTDPEVGETVNFDASGSSDSDGTIESYDWGFGDGNSGGGQTTTHSYSSAGLKTVTLTVTDNDGLTDEVTKDIDLKSGPCGPMTVSASDTSASSGTTADTTVIVDTLPDGLNGYIVSLGLSSTGAAEFTCNGGDQKGVTFLNPGTAGNVDSCSANSVTFRDTDFGDTVEPGATGIALAKVSIKGVCDPKDKCDISVSVNRLEDDNGNLANPCTQSGKFSCGCSVAFPDPDGEGGIEICGPPQDLDGDSDCEDLNGCGTSGFHDSILLSYNVGSGDSDNPVNKCSDCLNFDGENGIGFSDAIWHAHNEVGAVSASTSLGQSIALGKSSSEGVLTGGIYLSKAPEGLAGYILELSTTKGEIKKVNQLTPSGAAKLDITSNGTEAEFRAVDFAGQVQQGAEEVKLAEFKVKGTKDLNLTPLRLETDTGDLMDPSLLELTWNESPDPLVIENYFAYPNPAGDTVHFQVQGQGIEHIKVSVLDPQGNTVYSSQFVAGNGIGWDLTTKEGVPVSNGIYQYLIMVRGEDGQSKVVKASDLLVLK